MSLTTFVATTGICTCSFASISDDVHNVHTRFAIGKNLDLFYNNDPVHSQMPYIRNKATNHFKRTDTSCTYLGSLHILQQYI